MVTPVIRAKTEMMIMIILRIRTILKRPKLGYKTQISINAGNAKASNDIHKAPRNDINMPKS